MQIDPKVVWRLNEASDALNRAASALEDRKANLATTIQKQGLADLNRAVVELLGAMNQMNQQMSMAGMENMLEQLQQLAQNQGQLNEMTQNLSQQMRQQGRTPGLEQMLKRMGYEQQLIREATERLADMMEKFSQALGDLHGVAEEMKKVEMELEGGNINQKILEKQRQILTRMLESAKSLQKRDVSKKRQSAVAETPINLAKDAPPLDPKLLGKIQQLESNLRSGGVETLPLEYREQIERYFKALSLQTRRASRSEE
jgi:DNA repair ATPase RecN